MKFSLRFPFVLDLQQQANNEGFVADLNQLAQFFYVGTGSPNGAVTASPPAVYFNRSGGAATTWYVKESGVNTNTGWVGK